MGTDVFLNLAFDPSYEWLLVAFVSGLASLGLTARSVLEHPPDETRLDRLLKTISGCGTSLHDLSWLEPKDPRFNMAFELGLAVAVAKLVAPSQRKFFLFEREQHRMSRTLSDLAGYDALIHDGKPRHVLIKLHGALRHADRKTSLSEMERVHEIVTAAVPHIEKQYGTLFSASGFAALVSTAREAADETRARRS